MRGRAGGAGLWRRSPSRFPRRIRGSSSRPRPPPTARAPQPVRARFTVPFEGLTPEQRECRLIVALFWGAPVPVLSHVQVTKAIAPSLQVLAKQASNVSKVSSSRRAPAKEPPWLTFNWAGRGRHGRWPLLERSGRKRRSSCTASRAPTRPTATTNTEPKSSPENCWPIGTACGFSETTSALR